MLHLRGGVKEMDKKDTELKKEETKNKKEIKKQEYSVEEYAKNAENLFSTKPECV